MEIMSVDGNTNESDYVFSTEVTADITLKAKWSPTTTDVGGNISFGDDLMLSLVMTSGETGSASNGVWTFDLSSDLGVNVSGWQDTYLSYKLSSGKHDLGMVYAECEKDSDSIKFSIGGENGLEPVLEIGEYQLFITVDVKLNGSDRSITVAGTFDIEVVD